MQQKQIHDRLKEEHEQAIQLLQKAHRVEMENAQQRNTALEQMVQKLQFQGALVDSYFKKKEETLLRDYDGKVCGNDLNSHPSLNHQISMLKSLESNSKESHRAELLQLQDLLQQKDLHTQQRDDHILELNNKIADLKLELQNVMMQSEKNVMIFEKKGQHFLEKVSFTERGKQS